MNIEHKMGRGKSLILLSLMILMVFKANAQNHRIAVPVPYCGSKGDSLLHVIKNNLCRESDSSILDIFPSYSSNLRSEINSETKVVCLSGFAIFSAESYDYQDNVIDFLKFSNELTMPERFWLINSNSDSSFSLLAEAINMGDLQTHNDNKICFILLESQIDYFEDHWAFNVLTKSLKKEDLPKCFLFNIELSTEQFLLLNNEVYVITTKGLIPFSEFYSKRMSLEELKKEFEPVKLN